jgi:hypothetical protein
MACTAACALYPLASEGVRTDPQGAVRAIGANTGKVKVTTAPGPNMRYGIPDSLHDTPSAIALFAARNNTGAIRSFGA